MIGYDMPLMTVQTRRVWYNGTEWISCIARAGFWFDDPPDRRWTNTVQGFNGLPRVWGIRLLPLGDEVYEDG